FRERISGVWGNPPGEEKNGIPAAMVYDNELVITGVRYDNIIVCAQPKRGCAGSRCDGQVCKILHDPDIPPPHQYFATYHYIENEFGADCIVHVGTHGNIEFLPGKGVGLSKDCCPDMAIGNKPHLYIYNSDNPTEGAIAKRRSYAVLIDHMQAQMVKSGISDELDELENFLGEYYEAKEINKPRAHQLEHLIKDALHSSNLINEIRYTDEMPFGEIVQRTHEAISLVKSSQINEGLHIFGELPENEKRAEYIAAIFRADTDNGLSLRSKLFELSDVDLHYALNNKGLIYNGSGSSYGRLLDQMDEICLQFIRNVCQNRERDAAELLRSLLGDKLKREPVLSEIQALAQMVLEVERRIGDSKEINSLMSGFDAKYIPAGPSGKVTRGRYDVLPTGKNFYTLDIYRLPTKGAYNVGIHLADGVIEKHIQEEGNIPENMAIYWTCMDITCCDGEAMAQMMALMGTRPVWAAGGRIQGFEIIPLEELKRPRIDVTIRIGGINRDNFPECYHYIDGVIRAVAALNEPPEMNFVRKHALEKMDGKEASEDEKAWREATARIFGSKPGTYMSGVNLAVKASAWKDEKDLAEIFVHWNQYAYGTGLNGKEAPESFVSSLKTVDVTFNKVYTDEYDLFVCCAFYGTQGGLSVTSKHISGKNVKTYYGDTRDIKNVRVRDVADEIRRISRAKILNPKWIEGMKKHGYKGLADMSKKIANMYGWEATTQKVDDWIFDDVARTYILDDEMRKAFEKENPWALEEIGRRLLEASERGLWDADPEVLEELKDKYLEMESWIEERMGDIEGDFQGGSVDIFTQAEIEAWKQNIGRIHNIISTKK
ncbi:MAG: cobaltochelatase subunit CobN, partial [Bacteroidetes bacterium]|nr:cobaltochelatase subunit CobN [Bacteroidota bacterium]